MPSIWPCLLEERLRTVLLEIPDPYDKVPSLVTAGDVRYREKKDQPPYVTQLRDSWVGLPAMGRVNPKASKEKGGHKDLNDILDGCLSKGKLLEVLQGHEPQEVYALLSRLLDSKGNGGTPAPWNPW